MLDSLKLFGHVVNTGLINPNQYNAPQANRFKESLFGGLGLVPGVGDAVSAIQAADYWNQGDKANAGLAGLGALPLIPSLAGVTKGERLFRGTASPVDAAAPISRRFKNPGGEFGVHATVDPEVAAIFMQHGNPADARMHTLESNVDKPLRLRDTGGVWEPHQVAAEILHSDRLYQRRQAKIDEGFVPFDHLPEVTRKDYIERGIDNPNALYHKDTGAPWLDRPDLGDKFSPEGIAAVEKLKKEYETLKFHYGLNYDKQSYLKDLYTKKMQDVIKGEGYDHISYTNTVERNPRTGDASESVILFHPENVSVAPAEHIEYSDPFKDTTY